MRDNRGGFLSVWYYAMIQLREVTATLCIFKGPQWLHLCCWLLAFESFYLVVEACCDVAWLVVKCTTKWHGLLPEPNSGHFPSQTNCLFPIPYGSYVPNIFLNATSKLIVVGSGWTVPCPYHWRAVVADVWVWPTGSNLYYGVSVWANWAQIHRSMEYTLCLLHIVSK